MICRLLCAAFAGALLGVHSYAGTAAFPEPIPGTIDKVCQITGDFDRERGVPTRSRTNERAGVPGTDLGNPVEHGGRLYFLFGDVPGQGRRRDRDPIAFTTSTDPEALELEFLLDSDGLFRPITIPGIGQRGFEVPGGGISIGNALYIVFTTDHTREKTMGRSVLAVSEDMGRNFEYLYDLSIGKFINCALVEVEGGQIEGLPGADSTTLVWGSGDYRKSSPYLACIPSAKIRDKSAMRYFGGLDGAGQSRWGSKEAEAVPLFDHKQIGEFSVVWCEPLKHWLMLYNSLAPRGIVFRCAKDPWGPWTEARLIFEPQRDGYGQFMHSLLPRHARTPSLADPGREDQWGGEYAPYMIPRYFQGDNSRCTIYFLMSTWNPYQVVLMRADIGYASR